MSAVFAAVLTEMAQKIMDLAVAAHATNLQSTAGSPAASKTCPGDVLCLDMNVFEQQAIHQGVVLCPTIVGRG